MMMLLLLMMMMMVIWTCMVLGFQNGSAGTPFDDDDDDDEDDDDDDIDGDVAPKRERCRVGNFRDSGPL